MDEEERAFTEELRRALRQAVPTPEGLTDRIVNRIMCAGQDPANRARPTRGAWQKAAAVLVCAILLGLGAAYHEQARHRQTVRAEQQFTLAMRITSYTFDGIRQQIDAQLRQAIPEVNREEK